MDPSVRNIFSESSISVPCPSLGFYPHGIDFTHCVGIPNVAMIFTTGYVILAGLNMFEIPFDCSFPLFCVSSIRFSGTSHYEIPIWNHFNNVFFFSLYITNLYQFPTISVVFRLMDQKRHGGISPFFPTNWKNMVNLA